MRKDNYVRIRCGTDMGSIARKDDGFDGTGLDGIEKLWSAVVDVEACCVGAWVRGCVCRRKQTARGMGLNADANNRREEEKKRGVQARAAF